MTPNSNFRDLLKLFGEFGVRYLIAGGYDNAERVYRALAAFGAPLQGITRSDFETEGLFYQMGRPPVRVDILTGRLQDLVDVERLEQ